MNAAFYRSYRDVQGNGCVAIRQALQIDQLEGAAPRLADLLNSRAQAIAQLTFDQRIARRLSVIGERGGGCAASRTSRVSGNIEALMGCVAFPDA